MNGAPLPPQHGAPLRLVVPGWYGMAQVKWLTADRRHRPSRSPASRTRRPTGSRSTSADDGEPVTRIRPRSLLAPPGLAGLHDPRAVRAAAGPVTLSGRAWSGRAPVTRVEVSTDGGTTWADGVAGAAGPAAPLRLAGVDLRLDGRARPHRAADPGHRRDWAASRSSRSGTGRAWPTTWSSACRSPCWPDQSSCSGAGLLLDDDRAQPRPQGEGRPRRRSCTTPTQRLALTPPALHAVPAVVDQAHDDQDDAVEADQPGDDVADVEGPGRVLLPGPVPSLLIAVSPGSAEDHVEDDDHAPARCRPASSATGTRAARLASGSVRCSLGVSE